MALLSNLSGDNYQHVLQVYQVFSDFFGESHTDLQCDTERDNGRPYILVWWPRVTVTNEHNNSVLITDLYAKVLLELDGTIPYESRGFTLNRGSYTSDQFYSNYMHSHICDIPKGHFQSFQLPCLGRGPIIQTINSLKMDSDETKWMLFCQELSMYVQVESITGVPYRYLERIGAADRLYGYEDYPSASRGYSRGYSSGLRQFQNTTLESGNSLLNEFTHWYLQHGHLVLKYQEGIYQPAMSFFDFMIDISNAFIEFYNTQLKSTQTAVNRLFTDGILLRVFASDGKFYQLGSSQHSNDYAQGYQGALVCHFKGQEVHLHITSSSNNSEMLQTSILEKTIAMKILINITQTINYKYKNEHNINSDSQALTTTHQRTVCL